MTSALANIKVLDLSRILAGPWASQMLADMGATVIKVEKPFAGDDTRKWGPPFIESNRESNWESGQEPKSTANSNNESGDDSAYFHCANRNKLSIAVDIRQPEGQKIVSALIKQCDVFIENYKVGGLAKYGLSYDDVKQINPKLVYCSITGFGQSGPYAHKAGYDAMIQGEGGLMSITGEPDGLPMKVGVALVDVMTGLYSCNGILAALLARQHTGTGQHIDISLLDVQFAALANQGMNYLTTGENPKRLGNGHPNIVPYQTFKTEDGALILAVGNDQQFKKFCCLAKLEELAIDVRFSTNQARVENRVQLIPILAKQIQNKTTQWWIHQLEQISVPCGAVNTIEDVVNHPQIKHREMVKQVPNALGEPVLTIANPINLSKTPLQYQQASPALGQHTQQVLENMLALTTSEIATLKLRSIVQ